MTLEELEKKIQEKENELKELKQQKLFMTQSHKSRVFPTVTARKYLLNRGYTNRGYRHDYDMDELKKETILKVTNGRTDSLDEVTYDEYSLLNDVFFKVVKKKLRELNKEKKRQKEEELERKRKYQEEFKVFIELDELIDKKREQRYWTRNLTEEDKKKLEEEIEMLREKLKKLMKERNVKREFNKFEKCEPV